MTLGFSYREELPAEFRLLSMLHNIGAVTPERSMTVEEITKWTDFDASAVSGQLQKLKESGYVQFIEAGGIGKYHLTTTGITKVLTLYS